LAAALINFHEAVPTIHDNDSGHFGGYANLPGVLSNIGPALRSNGLVVSQLPEDINGQPGLRTTLMHTSGEYLSAVTPLPVNKGANATQEWGKAMTYSRRYGLLSVLGLCVGIIDNDGDLDADAKPAARLQTQQTPKKGPAVEGVAKDDQPLTTEERNMLVGLIGEMSPGKREDFCKSFRFAFKLGDNAKVAPAITSRKHQVWIQENA
jgi:hypothetical protein